MRTAKGIISVMRTVGVAFLCLAILFSIYSLANTASMRTSMLSELGSRCVQTDLTDGLLYDMSMFRALSTAAFHSKGSVNVRLTELKKCFDRFTARAEQAEEDANAKAYAAAEERLEKEFDGVAYLEKYENAQESREASLVTELCESLDSLSAKVSKSGKALPKAKNSSCRPVLEAAYAQLQGSGEEDVGSLYEYVSVVSELMESTGSKDVSAFVGELSKEDYLKALEELRAGEDAAAKTPADTVCEVLGQDGWNAGQLLTALTDGYTKACGTDPDARVFAETVCRLLIDQGSTDFTFADMRKLAATIAQEESFDTYLTGMCTELIDMAVLRADIPGIGIFYLLVSFTLHMWVLAAVLLIAPGVWNRVLTAMIVRRTVREADTAVNGDEPLLRVEHLKQYFGKGDAVTRAVDDVSFFIRKGEVFGLVGESGCGKTTTGRTIINLYDPTDGDVYLSGLRISTTKGGLSVYRSSQHAKYRAKVRKMKYETEAAVKADPSQRTALMRAFREKRGTLHAELIRSLDRAEIHAIESEAEKSRCTARFREARKAQITEIYQLEMKSLTGEQARERTRLYRQDLRLAGRETLMSRMQMIFQDPIASIDPRMTVREIISEGLIIRGMHDKAQINKRVDEMLELVGLVPEHADRYPHEFSGGQRQRIGIARAVIMEPDLIIADEPVSALDVSIQAQVLNLMNDLRQRMGLTIMFIAHNLSVVKYFSDRIGVMYYGKLVEVAESEELFAHPMHPYTRALLSAIPYPDPYYEKHRTRIVYKPEPVPEGETEELREVRKGHFVQCTQAVFEQLRKESV